MEKIQDFLKCKYFKWAFNALTFGLGLKFLISDIYCCKSDNVEEKNNGE